MLRCTVRHVLAALCVVSVLICVPSVARRSKRNDLEGQNAGTGGFGAKKQVPSEAPVEDDGVYTRLLRQFNVFESVADSALLSGHTGHLNRLDLCREQKIYWDDHFCDSYAVQGDLSVCGDLRLGGRLFVFTAFNATQVFDDKAQHIRERCSLTGSTHDGTLIVSASNLYVSGSVEVGGSLIAEEVHISGGGNVAIGVRGLLPARSSSTGAVSPEAIESFECPLLNNTHGWIVDDPDDASVGEDLSSKTIVGDLIAQGTVFLDNGANMWVFGNIAAFELLLDDSSSCHSLCGHGRTNLTHGSGIAVVDGSCATFGGLLDTFAVQIFLQDATVLYLKGILKVASTVQVDDASEIHVGQDLISAVLAVDDASMAIIGGDLDVKYMAEAIDGGSIIVDGSMETGALQCFDAGSASVKRNVTANEFVTLDGMSSAVMGGPLTVNSNLHVSNSSTLSVNEGSLWVNGTIRVFSSKLFVEGHLDSKGRLLAGKGSTVHVARDVSSRGITRNDIESILQGLNISYVDFTNNSAANVTETVGTAANATEMVGRRLAVPGNDSQAAAEYLQLTTQPALYLDSSNFTSGGKIVSQNSWIELERKSSLAAAKGMTIHNGMLILSSASQVRINNGSLDSNVGVTLDAASRLHVIDGWVTGEILEIAERSMLQCFAANVSKTAEIRGRSLFELSGPLTVGGPIITVKEGSTLGCSGLEVPKGDVFVQSRGKILVLEDGIVVQGTIAAQDKGVISTSGNITCFGSIISENASKLRSFGTMKSIDGMMRRTAESVLESRSDTFNTVYLQAFPSDMFQAKDADETVAAVQSNCEGSCSLTQRWSPTHDAGVSVDIKQCDGSMQSLPECQTNNRRDSSQNPNPF